MPIYLLAALVVAAAIVRFADEVACGEVTVTVVSADGKTLLLLDVAFAVLRKRSKSNLRVELDPAGGCWMQASFRACKSVNLYVKNLRVKGRSINGLFEAHNCLIMTQMEGHPSTLGRHCKILESIILAVISCRNCIAVSFCYRPCYYLTSSAWMHCHRCRYHCTGYILESDCCLGSRKHIGRLLLSGYLL